MYLPKTMHHIQSEQNVEAPSFLTTLSRQGALLPFVVEATLVPEVPLATTVTVVTQKDEEIPTDNKDIHNKIDSTTGNSKQFRVMRLLCSTHARSRPNG